ncbi:MAG: mannose-1-phosphate guanylyltransferase [Lachnospiraceae bacterium]|jgi:mannose-1-phosphate guanylyltransferase|nr:mannose-1-phosphate guanylyltransferase [Lachnospiraceae bacterium]
MKNYGVIMAGGGGTRFWPLSRQELPKQFLNLTGDDLMINEAIERLLPSIAAADIFVVTNVNQVPLVQEATAGVITPAHILAEPAARNTAACIGYAAIEICKKHGDGIMCIIAADHHIKNVDGFNQTLQRAIALATQTDRLITIGIRPSFPAVGYGYIKYNPENEDIRHHEVTEFVEKPDITTARRYLQEGGYLWNSGMFIWRASTILRYFEELLPDVRRKLMEIEAALLTDREAEVIAAIYPTIPKISIDYGIMERAAGVTVVESDFDWSDVGSWDALETFYPQDQHGNISNREQLMIDTQNCVLYAKSKLIATLGVEDLIIVEAEDAIMVCHKDKAQSVREISEELLKQGRMEYL